MMSLASSHDFTRAPTDLGWSPADGRAEPESVLVLAAVESLGLVAKYEAWAHGFRAAGAECQPIFVQNASDLLTALATSSARTVFLRRPGFVRGLRRELARARTGGKQVVIELPTPYYVGLREIRAQHTRVRSVRAMAGMALATGACLHADLIVQAVPDHWPWKWLGGERITVGNGADLALRPPPIRAWNTRKSCKLVMSASPAPWHGIDRVIRGLVAHADAELLLVGDHEAFEPYMRIAETHGVGGRVRTVGPLSGIALWRVLASADCGVSSLGLHRLARGPFAPLKAREYLACGLPVIFTGQDDALRSCTPLALEVPATDAPLDICDVVTWLDTLRAAGTGPADARRIAEVRFSYAERANRILRVLSMQQRPMASTTATMGAGSAQAPRSRTELEDR